MPANANVIISRLDALIKQGKDVPPSSYDSRYHVDQASMTAWRTRCIAFLERTLRPADAYTEEFTQATKGTHISSRDSGVLILSNLRDDLELGYLDSFYLGVAGEVIADLMDLSAWALGEKSKEAGAILAGSGLELGLRRIATVRGVDIAKARGIDDINQALTDASVYGPLRRGQVDSWRILRNHAVHGEHDDYSDTDVRLMIDGVRTLLAEELR